jgi:thiol-disulfide isomerase/thioredoxin
MMKRLIAKCLTGLTGALFVLSVLFAHAALAAAPTSAAAPVASEAVQQLLTLELQNERGKKMAFRQWRGRVLVINFWATWCPPCKAEIPAFSRLHTAWKKKGAQFVGIAIDNSENVQAFVDKTKVSYPQLIDDGQMMQRLRALGDNTQGLPFTLVINRRGEVVERRMGVMDAKALEALLAAETAAPQTDTQPTRGRTGGRIIR